MNPPDLYRIISRVDDLPTLPRTVLRITELVNDPKSSARDLARVITDDQVLAARLLKLVNSSFYGFPQRISTITGAIVLLGFDAIRNLLLTTSVFDLFTSRKKAGVFRQEQFWDIVTPRSAICWLKNGTCPRSSSVSFCIIINPVKPGDSCWKPPLFIWLISSVDR